MSSALRAPEPRLASPAVQPRSAVMPSVCFVGLSNLAVLAPEIDSSGAAGEPVQHTLLATALARRGHRVSMVVADNGQLDGAIWDGVQTFKAYARNAGLPILRFLHPRWTGLNAALGRADVLRAARQAIRVSRRQRRGLHARCADRPEPLASTRQVAL
jgi:hypothetical protein